MKRLNRRGLVVAGSVLLALAASLGLGWLVWSPLAGRDGDDPNRPLPVVQLSDREVSGGGD